MMAANRLGRLIDMLLVGAGPLSRAMHDLGMMRGSLTALISAHGDEARLAYLQPGVAEYMVEHLQDLRVQVIALGALSAKAAVDRLIEKLGKKDLLDQESVSMLIEGMESRLYDDLAGRHVYALDPTESEYFSGNHFGSEVIGKFNSASYDCDEAAKCLAFNRSTAAVFHLMRIVEIGLSSVYKCLGITVPLVGNDRNWGTILRRINTEIANRGSNFNEKDTFKEIYALLDAIKDAWRNPTMHVENKKTEEEAKIIFITVRSFMKRLSSRMDENGLPLA